MKRTPFWCFFYFYFLSYVYVVLMLLFYLKLHYGLLRERNVFSNYGYMCSELL